MFNWKWAGIQAWLQMELESDLSHRFILVYPGQEFHSCVTFVSASLHRNGFQQSCHSWWFNKYSFVTTSSISINCSRMEFSVMLIIRFKNMSKFSRYQNSCQRTTVFTVTSPMSMLYSIHFFFSNDDNLTCHSRHPNRPSEEWVYSKWGYHHLMSHIP